MPKVTLFNIQGEQVGEIELSDDVFGTEVRPDILHRAMVNYLANQRQGTANTYDSGRGSRWRTKT